MACALAVAVILPCPGSCSACSVAPVASRSIGLMVTAIFQM